MVGYIILGTLVSLIVAISFAYGLHQLKDLINQVTSDDSDDNSDDNGSSTDYIIMTGLM
jgi:hypothetical protein